MTHALRVRQMLATNPIDGIVFPSSTGGYLDQANVRHRVLQPPPVPLESKGPDLHMLRHTCASMLFEAHKDIKQVQEWLGHHDPGITLRVYVHLLDRGLGDAAFMDDIVR